MRIAIITSDSFFSYLLISDLVKQRQENIVSIIISPSRIKGKGTLQTTIQVLRKTGWINLVYKVVSNLWFYFAGTLYKLGIVRHCITPSNIARRYNIDLYHTKDCNSDATLEYLRNKNIDILLSINVYQRLLGPILSIPKIAAANSHFGLLPKYRGMAPYIWAMANGEKEIGLSVHHMTLKFDEGKLIRQQRVQIEPKDSAMGIYIRGCLTARKMITEAISDLEKNPNAGFEQVGEGTYFSMPTRQCISNLRQRGYCLWKIKDLFLLLNNNLGGEPLV